MDEIRSQRVAEAIREELSEMIGYEMSDPRVNSVQVTEVLVSPDSKQARVRVSAQDEDALEALEALDGARAFLRKQLAQRLQLRKTPELLFEADSGVSSERVEKLLRRVRRGRPRE
jgi:ribosome-binding factor A